MTYTLRFLPDLEEDAIGGYAWYEGKSPGLFFIVHVIPVPLERNSKVEEDKTFLNKVLAYEAADG